MDVAPNPLVNKPLPRGSGGIAWTPSPAFLKNLNGIYNPPTRQRFLPTTTVKPAARNRNTIRGGENTETNTLSNRLKVTSSNDGTTARKDSEDTTKVGNMAGGHTKKPQVEDHDGDDAGRVGEDDEHRQSGDSEGDEEGQESGRDHGDDRRDGKTFQCRPISGKHSQFIEENLEWLQEQCKHFSACTRELYSAENYHRILAGENTRLRNICGLMCANGGGQYTTLNEECSIDERRAIRQIVGQNLERKLDNRTLEAPWRKLNKCVNAEKQNEEKAIDTVCRLRNKSRTDSLCGDEHVNTVTRDFFNQELEKQHCNCVAIKAAAGRGGRPAKAARFAIIGGVFCLLLVLIIAVIVLCLRHRKTRRKLKEHRIRYVTAVAREESSGIYQEVHDAPRAPKLPNRQLQEGKLLPHGYELDVAPSFPERYVKGLNLPRGSGRPPSDDDDRPHSYLEPLPDPVPRPSGDQGGSLAKGTQSTSAIGQGKGKDPYSLAKPLGESRLADAPYSLAKHVHESHHETSASDGYSLAKRADESSGTSVKGSESDGTYFDTLKLARSKAEDEFGYSKLRRPSDSNDSTADRESSAPQEPQYFELEAEVEKEEHRNSEVNAFTSSTKL